MCAIAEAHIAPLPPSRQVIHAEALAWLEANAAPPASSVGTSLPDLSELPERSFEDWRAWFVGVARRVIRWVPDEGVAIFYQSDIRHLGTWIDKGYLVMRAAEEESARLVWHKIVCRKPPGTITHGRASYSHMICVTRARGRASETKRPGPDVLPDAGFMPWSKAMGVQACRVACRYLVDEGATRVVVDPFCGHGTVLAVANELGMDAIGVDVSTKRCKAARRLCIDDVID